MLELIDSTISFKEVGEPGKGAFAHSPREDVSKLSEVSPRESEADAKQKMATLT